MYEIGDSHRKMIFTQMKEYGIIKPGHYGAGKLHHVDKQLRPELIFIYPPIVKSITNVMGKMIENYNVNMITGPNDKSLLLSSIIAKELTMPFIPTDGYMGEFGEPQIGVLKNYVDRIKGNRFIIIATIVREGVEIDQTISRIREFEGIVRGVICLWNIGIYKPDECPIAEVIDEKFEVWPEVNCPMCEQGRKMSD